MDDDDELVLIMAIGMNYLGHLESSIVFLRRKEGESMYGIMNLLLTDLALNLFNAILPHTLG